VFSIWLRHEIHEQAGSSCPRTFDCYSGNDLVGIWKRLIHRSIPSHFPNVMLTHERLLISLEDVLRGVVKKFPEFFDTDSLVHHMSLPRGQSVTVQVLQGKRRDKWQAGTVVSASR
jgi:hypothetical protein